MDEIKKEMLRYLSMYKEQKKPEHNWGFNWDSYEKGWNDAVKNILYLIDLHYGDDRK